MHKLYRLTNKFFENLWHKKFLYIGNAMIAQVLKGLRKSWISTASIY